MICIKDFEFDIPLVGSYQNGSEYEMEIIYPYVLKNITYIKSNPEIKYRVYSKKDELHSEDFDRTSFLNHFKSIKYNRKNTIKKLLGGG